MATRKPSKASKRPARAATKRVPKSVQASDGNGLDAFSMHASDAGSAPLVTAVRSESAAHRSIALTATPDVRKLDPETAARHYLQRALASRSVRAFTAPQAGGATSEFKSLGTETVPLTGTTTVKFRQYLAKIPVYGSLVTVELDEGNRLIGVHSALGTPEGVSPLAKISASQAMTAVKGCGDSAKDLAGVVPALHYWFDQASSRWRLVFIFEDVRVTPGTKPTKGEQPRVARRRLDYVVDAHSGKVVAELPRTASLADRQAKAVDGLGARRKVSVVNKGKKKLLKAGSLNVQTFDFDFKDPDLDYDALPGRVVGAPPGWSPAAVSAQANAEDVARYLRAVLKRNNIDNKGGAMNSSINCVLTSEAEGQVWPNAYWNGTQMVYGQVLYQGELLSICVDLEVVAHEMFHGVTDSTARLEYANQSGALNESYSDIFGVIIAHRGKPDTSTWSWKIGERLDTGGKPFRDMSAPGRRGQPSHMKSYRRMPNTDNGDWGGVHVNSGIHNKAGYLMLTAKGSGKTAALSPEEVAAIFYLALTQRLSRTSHFADSRRAVVQSALTLFRKLPLATRKVKIGAIDDAFDKVGIKGKRAQVV